MPDQEKSYRIFTGKSEAHKAFNSLKGIIDGISIDNLINEKEIKELENWCVRHEFLANRDPFKDLITNIQVIISDNEVTGDEIEDMKWLCHQFSTGFDFFDHLTSDMQILQGILHGMLSDGKITDNEIMGLSNWIAERRHLETMYPYDEIKGLLFNILKDGMIDETEKKILKKYISEFVNLADEDLQKKLSEELKDIKISGICTVNPSINIPEKLFCFTGKSSKSSRSEIAELIESNGGKFNKNLTKKTDYLIVGNDGNPCWSYATYGRKVEKAIEMRKSGSHIQIVNETDFWNKIS